MEVKQENAKFYEALENPLFQEHLKTCKIGQGNVYRRWQRLGRPEFNDTLFEILCIDDSAEFHRAYLVSEFNNDNDKTSLTDLVKKYCKSVECKQWIAEFKKETFCKSRTLCRLEYMLEMHYISKERYWELRDANSESIYTQRGYPSIDPNYVSKLQ